MEKTFDNQLFIENNFGGVDFRDKRLGGRLVKMASKMLDRPENSLPKQMQSISDTIAAYRFLANSKVNHETIQIPHRNRVVREAGETQSIMLYLQDTSAADYTNLNDTKGLGLIGNHEGKGFMMHSCLAVKYDELNPEVIGLAHQTLWTRRCVSRKQSETRGQRNQRANKESGVWSRTLKAMGSPPSGQTWVSVGDRANDIYEFFRDARKQKWEAVIRANQDRCIEVNGEELKLMAWAKSLPKMGSMTISTRRTTDTIEQTIELGISWGQVLICPPHRCGKKAQKLPLSVIRVWNEIEDIEWVLDCTLPVNTLEEAIEKAKWYSCRWIIEEYHKCLKTGCRVQDSQLSTAHSLKALIGILGIIAITMLQLRNIARADKDTPAADVIPKHVITIVCKRCKLQEEGLTNYRFWRAVAQLGGHLGRKSDGEPGWQSLWSGWLRLLDMIYGAEMFLTTVTA